MRVAIFDGILEKHVAESLERALRERGHPVFNTGKFGSGFSFSTSESMLLKSRENAEAVCEFKPDLILVFRPASAPVAILKLLKSSGATVAAWLSDDPVLWRKSYRQHAGEYDILLHCGDADVISFYENETGHKKGINFPFWTDSQAFPKVYGTQKIDSDIIFLGQTQGNIRRARYHDLAQLQHSVKIHGKSGVDYANLSGGYLDSEKEVLDSCARSRIALSFPQLFEKYRDTDFWFSELRQFEFFPYPSRIIQYAAMGLPIISVSPSSFKMRHFPEVICVDDSSEVDGVLDKLIEDGGLKELGNATHDRFMRSFSAKSRVLALEALLADDSWRNLDAQERADWFTQFDGSQKHLEFPKSRSIDPGSVTKINSASPKVMNILYPFSLVDTAAGIWDMSGSKSLLSTGESIKREFADLGIEAVNLQDKEAASLFSSMESTRKLVFIVFDDAGLTAECQDLLSSLHEDTVRVLIFRGESTSVERIFAVSGWSRDSTYLVVRSFGEQNLLIKRGFPSSRVLFFQGLVDTPFLRKLGATMHENAEEDKNLSQVCVFEGGGTYLEGAVLRDIEMLNGSVRHIKLEEERSLQGIVDAIKSSKHLLTGLTQSKSGMQVPDWHSCLLASRRPTYYVRHSGDSILESAGVDYLLVGGSGEMLRKMERVETAHGPSWLEEQFESNDSWFELNSCRALLNQILGDSGFSNQVSAKQSEGLRTTDLENIVIDLADSKIAKAFSAIQFYGGHRGHSVQVDIHLEATDESQFRSIQIQGATFRRRRFEVPALGFRITLGGEFLAQMPILQLAGVGIEDVQIETKMLDDWESPLGGFGLSRIYS